MPKTPDTRQTLYGTSREMLETAERKNEILAEIAGEEYTAPESIPHAQYSIDKRMLAAKQKENELLESIAGGGEGGVGANKLAIDYGTDVLSLKHNDTAIEGSGVTLPAYGISYDSGTGGLTLTKNGAPEQGQTVSLPPYGAPQKASTAAAMTDTSKVYVYTGSESGYNNGYWYYYDENLEAWTSGGVYNSQGIDTDTTLLVEGAPADAKATGDAVSELKTQMNAVSDAVMSVGAASGNPATLYNAVGNAAFKKFNAGIELKQAGTGDPSPSNIRPITGFDEVTITQYRKNLLNITADTQVSNGVTFRVTKNAKGHATSISTSGTASGTAVFRQMISASDLPAGVPLILNGCPAGGNFMTKYAIALTNAVGSALILNSGDDGNGIEYTPEQLANTAQLQIIVRNGINADGLVFKPMIRFATDEDGTFEPFEGKQSATVTLSSEAGTVYGGTLDVTAGTLTVERALVTLDGHPGEQWNSGADAGDHSYFIHNIGAFGDVYDRSGVCTHFPDALVEASTTVVGQRIINSSARNAAAVFIRPENVSSMTTVSLFKAWLAEQANGGTPVQVAYKLTNPITYTLTPSQITALAGTSCVMADSGPVDVEYLQNAKIPMWIANESDFVTSRAYARGEYVIIAGILYEVTADVSSGEKFIVGTNIAETNVGDELYSLNASTDETVTVKPSELVKYRGTIVLTGINAGIWTNNGTSADLYVEDAKSVVIAANDEQRATVWFMKSPGVPDDRIGQNRAADLSDITPGFIRIEPGETQEIPVPSDAKYLNVVYMYDNNIWAPESIEIRFENGNSKKYKQYTEKRKMTETVENTYKRMIQMRDVEWDALGQVYASSGSLLAESGEHVGTGIPYSSVKQKDKYVGFNVTYRTFMTAAHNRFSLLYTEKCSTSGGVAAHSGYGISYIGSVNCGAYFGQVCNTFALHCVGMPIPYNSDEFAYLCKIGVFEKVEEQSAEGAKPGDVCWIPHHAYFVSDVARGEDGTLLYVEESEATGIWSATKRMSPERFNEYLRSGGGGAIYRYRDLCKNIHYTPLPFIHVWDENENYTYEYNDDICTYAGDYASFFGGHGESNPQEPIFINCNLGSTVYDTLEVCRADHLKWKPTGASPWPTAEDFIVPYATYPLSGMGSLNEIMINGTVTRDGSGNITGYTVNAPLPSGKYIARLKKNGIADSAPTHFEVIDSHVEITKTAEDTYEIDFSSANGSPLYVQTVLSTGNSLGIHALTVEEIENGKYICHPKAMYDSQYAINFYGVHEGDEVPDGYDYGATLTQFPASYSYVFIKVFFVGEYGTVRNDPIALSM